jgi:hypothetical protein
MYKYTKSKYGNKIYKIFEHWKIRNHLSILTLKNQKLKILLLNAYQKSRGKLLIKIECILDFNIFKSFNEWNCFLKS